MIPSIILPFAVGSLLFARSAIANNNDDDDDDSREACLLTTCWASFSWDCEGGSHYCSFNDSNSFPEFDYPGQEDPRLVLIDKDIGIEWRDQNKSHPVRISWHWWAENDTDETEELVGVRQFPSIKWDKNVTGEDLSTIINFWKIIQEDFPNNHTNMTSWEVLSHLQNNDTDMVLAIYQPESPKYKKIQDDWDAEPEEYQLFDYSDSFKLSQYNGEWEFVERYFAAQYSRGRNSVLHKWRLGVGVGVGVGVPVITLVALFGGYLLGKKFGRSQAEPLLDNASS